MGLGSDGAFRLSSASNAAVCACCNVVGAVAWAADLSVLATHSLVFESLHASEQYLPFEYPLLDFTKDQW
jgi:hypothetical protein